MEAIGVLMACPMNSYLEEELDKRFKLFRFWNYPQKQQFLKENSNSIRAVVGNATAGADGELIEALPKLEIVSSFSVGLDKIDLNKCKDKGIRVTNTPDVLTEDVADLAIGLMLSVLRKICICDRYVRRGLWKSGDFELTTRFGVSDLNRMTDIDESSISDFRMDQLHTVTMKHFTATPNELVLAKILLRCAPVLEKMLVEEKDEVDPKEQIKSLRELSGQTCQICGELFVACNECAFPVCRTCYEYERREGNPYNVVPPFSGNPYNVHSSSSPDATVSCE